MPAEWILRNDLACMYMVIIIVTHFELNLPRIKKLIITALGKKVNLSIKKANIYRTNFNIINTSQRANFFRRRAFAKTYTLSRSIQSNRRRSKNSRITKRQARESKHILAGYRENSTSSTSSSSRKWHVCVCVEKKEGEEEVIPEVIRIYRTIIYLNFLQSHFDKSADTSIRAYIYKFSSHITQASLIN